MRCILYEYIIDIHTDDPCLGQLHTNTHPHMYTPRIHSGADPGFRRGGVRTFRRGGGVRTGISGADPNCCRALGKLINKQKEIADRRGGGSDHPPKKPVSAPDTHSYVFLFKDSSIFHTFKLGRP